MVVLYRWSFYTGGIIAVAKGHAGKLFNFNWGFFGHFEYEYQNEVHYLKNAWATLIGKKRYK